MSKSLYVYHRQDEEDEEERKRRLLEALERQIQNEDIKTEPFEDDLDTSNMTLRQELQARFNALNNKNDEFDKEDANEKSRKALVYANQVKQSIPHSLDIENAVVKNDNSLSPLQKVGKMTWNNFKNFNPGIRMGEALGELAASKEEMDDRKEDGYDNYAHRYGMYTNAKDGLDKALYTLGWGLAKEANDIYKKSIKGSTPLIKTLQDSYKDMRNNIEGVYVATKNNLQGNDIDGRLWLDDFDYLHNRWKRRRRR